MLPDVRMLFTCYEENKVIAINRDGTKDLEIKQYSCFDIDYADNNIIFVTSGGGRQFQNIISIDIEKRKIIKTINIGGFNMSVVLKKEGTLIYCAWKNTLKTIDLRYETRGSI